MSIRTTHVHSLLAWVHSADLAVIRGGPMLAVVAVCRAAGTSGHWDWVCGAARPHGEERGGRALRGAR